MVDSERTWLVHFRGAPIESEAPKEFKFAAAKVDGAEMTYQRYVDADLAKVSPVVALESRYGEPTYAWAWRLGGGLLVVVLALDRQFSVGRS